MSKNYGNTPRMPATKFAHMRRKMAKNKFGTKASRMKK